ncbi:MAG: EamA family transporter [Geminicoccaceae bacterium]|nr:EamA family transporter [Geminicoccaceae bacterium]
MTGTWPFWALSSAVFAAATAILAKLGVAEVEADLATFLRTLVVLALLAAIVTVGGQWRSLGSLSPRGTGFLVASGLATGASWLCYFRAMALGDAARVAPVDKLSVVLVAVFAVCFLGERLDLGDWSAIVMIFAGVLLLAVRS